MVGFKSTLTYMMDSLENLVTVIGLFPSRGKKKIVLSFVAFS